MGFLREDVLKIVFKGQTNPKQIGRLEREEVSLLCFFLVLLVFFRDSLFLYCISLIRKSFSLLCIYFGAVHFYLFFIFLYCNCILELLLEVWRGLIDLGFHLGKLFLSHIFICILFMFFLGFLRLILFYIYYICEHFGSWIFCPSLLFSSLLGWVICSLYSTFWMYAHLPKLFCSSICLSFLFIILLKCVDMCYYTYCILFQVFYICVNFVLIFL